MLCGCQGHLQSSMIIPKLGAHGGQAGVGKVLGGCIKNNSPFLCLDRSVTLFPALPSSSVCGQRIFESFAQ